MGTDTSAICCKARRSPEAEGAGEEGGEVTGMKAKTNVELPEHLERLGLNEKQCIQAGWQRMHEEHSGKGPVMWSTENPDQLGSVHVKEKRRQGLHEPVGTWTPQMSGLESGVQIASCHISTGHSC